MACAKTVKKRQKAQEKKAQQKKPDVIKEAKKLDWDRLINGGNNGHSSS